MQLYVGNLKHTMSGPWLAYVFAEFRVRSSLTMRTRDYKIAARPPPKNGPWKSVKSSVIQRRN